MGAESGSNVAVGVGGRVGLGMGVGGGGAVVATTTCVTTCVIMISCEVAGAVGLASLAPVEHATIAIIKQVTLRVMTHFIRLLFFMQISPSLVNKRPTDLLEYHDSCPLI